MITKTGKPRIERKPKTAIDFSAQSIPTRGPWQSQGIVVSAPQPGLNTLAICQPTETTTGNGKWNRTTRKECEANARLMAAAPDLLASLLDLLADVTGPAMVYGNGIGNDGKKTGLSHQEFNDLRATRIANARAAIRKAEGK